MGRPVDARFVQVAEQINLWCQTQKLDIGLQPVAKPGSVIIGIYPASIWQTNHGWKNNLDQCQLKGEFRVDGVQISGKFRLTAPPRHYIFFTRESLHRCVGEDCSGLRFIVEGEARLGTGTKKGRGRSWGPAKHSQCPHDATLFPMAQEIQANEHLSKTRAITKALDHLNVRDQNSYRDDRAFERYKKWIAKRKSMPANEKALP